MMELLGTSHLTRMSLGAPPCDPRAPIPIRILPMTSRQTHQPLGRLTRV